MTRYSSGKLSLKNAIILGALLSLVLAFILPPTSSPTGAALGPLPDDEVFEIIYGEEIGGVDLPEGFFGIAKIKTTDGGLNWGNEELPMFGLSFAIDFRTASEGWSASGFKFLFSSDTGETWVEKIIPDSAIVYDLQFADSLTGFAVGADGDILKYIPKPVSVNDIQNKLDDFALYQNYPNPFNQTTRIEYGIAAQEFVSLKVYDVLGNEVAILVSEEKPAGISETTFNAASLSGGIYFYRLQAGAFSKTKKMIFLK